MGNTLSSNRYWSNVAAPSLKNNNLFKKNYYSRRGGYYYSKLCTEFPKTAVFYMDISKDHVILYEYFKIRGPVFTERKMENYAF